MAATARDRMKQKVKDRPLGYPGTSFDVTCVLGTVVFDERANGNPTMEAFSLIVEHDTPGEYTFPNLYGGTTRVIIEAPDQQIEQELQDHISS